MLSQSGIEVEGCRAALQKVLDSEYFAGSRRRSELLAYAADAALAGRTEIDQYEIADRVLGLRDFDPADDASVRKLATHLRQKLQEYYAGPGSGDPIIISLPRHSYVVRFRYRCENGSAPAGAIDSEAESEAISSAPAIAPNENTGGAPARVPSARETKASALPWKWLFVGALAGAAPFCTWFLVGAIPERGHGSSILRTATVIYTRQGDIRGKGFDIAPGAVRVGPEIADGEDATVRLRFTAQHPTQQAGLMAMFDADNYVRLGPQFKNRTLLEFSLEKDGLFDQGPASAYAFDPLGQAGLARWLSVRRNGDEYSGYVSTDGLSWTPFGGRVNLPAAGRNPRAAIYAFNGRSKSPSAPAVFDDFGAGISFHSRPNGAFRAAAFAGWDEKVRCATATHVNIANGALEVGFAADAIGCRWSLTKAAPEGDWAFTTLLDFEPVSGSSLGVVVQGSKEGIAVSRRDLDGRTLLLQRTGDRDVRIPDFPGTPPITLRVEKRGSLIRASASHDGEQFVSIPVEVRVGDLGTGLQVGVISSVAHWASQFSRPAARIYWTRIESLPLRELASSDVPARNGT